MIVCDPALRAAAALAMCAAALLVAGCGGRGKGNTVPVGASNNTSVCAYVKRVRPGVGGRIYVQIAASPKFLKLTACSAFNRTFGGRRISVNRMAETGRPYCGYTKRSSSYTIRLALFASGHKSGRTTGRAYCRSFHPGHGFNRDFLR
jgi:hypothetical protein